jgi:hypothetical protein
MAEQILPPVLQQLPPDALNRICICRACAITASSSKSRP